MIFFLFFLQILQNRSKKITYLEENQSSCWTNQLVHRVSGMSIYPFSGKLIFLDWLGWDCNSMIYLWNEFFNSQNGKLIGIGGCDGTMKIIDT